MEEQFIRDLKKKYKKASINGLSVQYMRTEGDEALSHSPQPQQRNIAPGPADPKRHAVEPERRVETEQVRPEVDFRVEIERR